MKADFTFSIKSPIGFDENYHPSDSTRLTTNFANLARGGAASAEPAQYAGDD